MSAGIPFETVDYLVVGHLSYDLTPHGPRLGGTAAYSALTARSLGLRVGIVSAWGGEIPLDILDGIQVHSIPTEHSTTFENKYTHAGRIQHIHHVAADLLPEHIPDLWQHTPIIHIGPIAGEAKAIALKNYPAALFVLTPQGWMRTWDKEGMISPEKWKDAGSILPRMGAAVISVEDVGGDEETIETMASACKVLAVTEGPAGSRLYWNGDLRRFRAKSLREVDATGAGDIFAAAFFWRLYVTRDPWAAARFATHLASHSVCRGGLAGIPTREEIQDCLVEII
jgi:sugar/nucleoside kinase (ribokinase family)